MKKNELELLNALEDSRKRETALNEELAKHEMEPEVRMLSVGFRPYLMTRQLFNPWSYINDLKSECTFSPRRREILKLRNGNSVSRSRIMVRFCLFLSLFLIRARTGV